MATGTLNLPAGELFVTHEVLLAFGAFEFEVAHSCLILNSRDANAEAQIWQAREMAGSVPS
jgi:hypothetical protein